MYVLELNPGFISPIRFSSDTKENTVIMYYEVTVLSLHLVHKPWEQMDENKNILITR